MNIFKIIKSRFKKKELKTPKIGSTWILKPDASPFPLSDDLFIVILDVREEWVRYRMRDESSEILQDNRIRLKSFLQIFVKQ